MIWLLIPWRIEGQTVFLRMARLTVFTGMRFAIKALDLGDMLLHSSHESKAPA